MWRKKMNKRNTNKEKKKNNKGFPYKKNRGKKKLEIGRGCGKRIVERINGLKESYICRTEKMIVGECYHLCPKCRKKDKSKIQEK